MNYKIVFKGLLVIQTLVLLAYTYLVFETEGASLFSVALSNVKSLNWSGQFNLDFLCYLILSGTWIMWRDKFSRTSILAGTVAIILGIVFFAPYLLWLMDKEKGDIKHLLLGNR